MSTTPTTKKVRKPGMKRVRQLAAEAMLAELVEDMYRRDDERKLQAAIRLDAATSMMTETERAEFKQRVEKLCRASGVKGVWELHDVERDIARRRKERAEASSRGGMLPKYEGLVIDMKKK